MRDPTVAGESIARWALPQLGRARHTNDLDSKLTSALQGPIMQWAIAFWFRTSVNAGTSVWPTSLVGLGAAQESLERVASRLGVRTLNSYIYVSAEDVEDC